jgi:hypothetical protein
VPRPAAIVEALAKLKANAAPNKDAHADNGTGEDFDDDDDVTTASEEKEEPPTKEKTTAEKPKKARSKAQPEQRSMSDLIDDEIPFP